MVLVDELVSGNQKCTAFFANDTMPGYCRPVWDRFLCWPPTPPGQPIQIRCPQLRGIDTSKFAYRICGTDGIWQGRPNLNDSLGLGWSNYTQCFPPGIRDLLAIFNAQSKYETQRKLLAAEGTRILEMIGLSISMISIIISLVIFCKFRNLWNNRTRIHRNLFIAMGIQVLVRLIVYSDQYLSRAVPSISPTADTNTTTGTDPTDTNNVDRRGIDNTEYVCESVYMLLEYARTSMFLWMFVEGLYLHNMITVAVFQERLSTVFYYCIGWGAPIILTLIWAIVTSENFHGVGCWWGYNLSPYFWILEGPRLTVIVLNLIFLLNIIRVLVTKLRESNSTEAQQVRKAVRAAIVLLPLLGITNALQMLPSPVDKDAVLFAIWSYLTTFLTSFQGFFCALIYCFLNGEVQVSIKRCFRGWRHHGNRNSARRRSLGVSIHMKVQQQEVKKEPNGPRKGRAGEAPNGTELRNKQIDPLKQYWTEAELSSHNNVDIEHIHIPEDYLIKHGRNLASRFEGRAVSSGSPSTGSNEGGSSNGKSSRPKESDMEEIQV